MIYREEDRPLCFWTMKDERLHHLIQNTKRYKEPKKQEEQASFGLRSKPPFILALVDPPNNPISNKKDNIRVLREMMVPIASS